MAHPIDNIVWIETDQLFANGWNPNVVLSQEYALIKVSLLAQGWLQPILVSRADNSETDGVSEYQIIDGYHRATLAKTDKDVIAAYGTKVPCAVLTLTEAERKILTVRINRAKGSHVAVKMHDLVTSLHADHGVSVADLCVGLGAEKAEIELLLQESIFTKMRIASTAYSRAWTPKQVNTNSHKK